MKKTAFIASLLILFQSIWLSFESHAQQPPDISAKSAILINATTGTVLYEHNAYAKRAMASTTKIMTALLTIEAGDLDKPFTVDSYAVQVEERRWDSNRGYRNKTCSCVRDDAPFRK